MRSPILAVLLLAACHHGRPLSQLPLHKVILYQNGIGYFERAGHVGSGRVELEFSRHEVDDVLKTLTVIDKQGGSVATVDVPQIADKDSRVRIGVALSGGKAHDVAVNYAVPTPTWKAAYRIVIDDASSLLQGWAVVDNASQEDWTNIALTLATGAPMSYALDLHTPVYVKRPDASGNMVLPVVVGVVGNERANAASGDPDGDGIPNDKDLCPNDPEDKDGFQDEDGCPDPDNDHDRIPDAKDKCPNEPETYNGYQDEDGCPDRGRVVVTDTSIEILDMIYFHAKEDRIKPQSYPILDAVVATLKGNPGITLMEVQGHAASGEPDALGLSDRRAGAVRAYLVGHGLDGKRLAAQGYGDSQPIDEAKTEAARAKNRRVAFLILKRSDGDADQPAKPVITTTSVAASVQTTTKPVEVAGAVRYELGAPVTVKRGSSTMVSILNKAIVAEDAYLWRPDANAPGSDRHPFRVVRLVNSSGFTLQPGPVAIFARGTFVGDSLLDRLDLDETSWIPYALDSGTTVTVGAVADERPVRLVALHKGVLTVENADVRVTKYAVAAGRQPAKQIYLRHARAAGYAASDLPTGAVDQGDAYLVPVALAPGKTSEVTVTERQPRRRTVQLVDAKAADVAVYVDGSHLEPALADKLRAAIALRKEMATIEQGLAEARDRAFDLSQRGYEIRDSLRALDKVRNADDLRKKLVANLAETTAKGDALAKELAAKTEALAAARAKLQDAIRDLALDDKP